MSGVWAAALAGAAAACLVGLPAPGAVRVRAVVAGPPPVERHRPAGRRASRPRVVLSRRGAALVAAVAMVLCGSVLGGSVLAGSVLGGRALVPLLLAAVGAGAAVRLRRSRACAEVRRDERARAVEACAALAAELRAGRGPAEALDAAAGLGAGPFAAALRTAAGVVRLGGDPGPSLRACDGSAVPEVLRSLAACWTVCAGSGGGLATAVERLEEGLRAGSAQRRAVDAELAGPRATAALLAVLPAGGLLLAAGLGADPVSVLLTTPVGMLCLTVGIGLDALGLWWTGRLVAAAGGRV